MPHEFPTVGHKTIPFGFFNVKIDLLIMQKRFFFAHDLCDAILDLAAGGEGSWTTLPCWRIDHPAMIGDLNGVLRGESHKGLYGAVYARWPLPPRRSDFRQDPDAHQTRDEVADLIEHIGMEEQLVVRWTGQVVTFGTVAVALPDLHAMLRHLRDGPPPWREGRLPEYLSELLQDLEQHASPLFS